MKPITLYRIRKPYGQDSVRYCISRYLVSFLLSLICFISYSQTIENNFEKINIEIDGENVYDVHVIIQDPQGFIWMGTNLGLIRYDGVIGKKYEINTASKKNLDYVHTMLLDSYGDLWIGADSGLFKYKTECDCLYEVSDSNHNIALNNIRAIAEDSNNNIWIGTKDDGLYRYETENDVFTRFFNSFDDSFRLTDERIDHLLIDRKNNLWIGTHPDNSINNSGLVHYNINTGTVYQFLNNPNDPNSLVDNRISAIYEDKFGQILIGTFKSGLHIYNQDSKTLTRINYDENNPNQLHATYSEESVFGEDPYVKLIHQDQNGDYWIGTTGKGINYFNSSKKEFKNYNFNLINPQLLWSIYEDRQGIIWIGGYMGSGLFKSDLFAKKYNVDNNFSNVEGAYESSLSPGILWVKSHEKGLTKLDLSTGERTPYLHNKTNTKSINHNWVRSIYQEDEETIWVGLGNGGAYGFQDGNGGVDRMDISTGEFSHFKLNRNDDGLGDFSYTVYSIYEDDEGYLWLGTGPGGIFRSNKEKTEFKHFKVHENHKASGDVFLNITRIDSNGNIWASDFADEGTLYLFNRKQGKFNTYLEGFKMYNLLIDDNGWLFISTWEKGLVHFNPIDRTYKTYTKKDGLLSNDGLDIIKGEDGIIWINTRMGPSKFNPETGEISSVGLPKKRYNTGLFKASDDRIYLGSYDGLYSFYPDQIGGNLFPPQLSISNLLISKKNYAATSLSLDNLKLSYDQNDLSFKYVGLHFSNPEKNSYKYRLKPIYDDWLHVGSEQTARYFNLSPGSYLFEVKASNSDGIWSNETATVKFKIKPPWWSTWWSYLIYLIIIGYLVNWVYRFQLSRKLAASESKRLREVNEFKNNLFTNITHEFRTPLTVIKGMTDNIRSKLKGKELNNVDISLEMIERNSDELLNLVNEMLDLAKIESGNMELQFVQSDIIPFIKYVCESFDSYAEENQIDLTIYSEIETLIMDFDSNKLTSVLSNLLSNAVKFTPEKGKIIVHINQITQNDKPYLFIKIKDTGIGIAEHELSNIFSRFYQTDASSVRENEGTGIGLALTKEIIDLMKGTIEVKSTYGKGSEFNVTIPITNNASITDKIQIDKVPQSLRLKSSFVTTKDTLDSDTNLPLILIVEDNQDVAHYLKTCLKDKFKTIHASNGTLGIEMALDQIPDIIISDVMMPEKDGFEVCETLKADERTDHIPIIILTAKASFEDKLKGLSHGADAYLAKPFVKEELFIRIEKLIAHRRKLINKIQKEGSGNLLKRHTKDPKLQFLKKIIKLIHEDISNSELNSEELAKKLHISESQVYRKLKAITGKSTAVYMRSIRLQYAKNLLLNSDKTVSEVAFDVGFNDPSWFSRAFKEEFGYSPSNASK